MRMIKPAALVVTWRMKRPLPGGHASPPDQAQTPQSSASRPRLAQRRPVEQQQGDRDDQQDGLVERARDRQQREPGAPAKRSRDPLVARGYRDRANRSGDEPPRAFHGSVNTILPSISPRSIASNPCRASLIGSVVSITGRTPRSTHSRISRSSSSRAPIVDPPTERCRKNMPPRPAGPELPVVAPAAPDLAPGPR